MTVTSPIRNKVAIVGCGSTAYYKHGQSPYSEFALTLQAIRSAAADAGIDVRDIDGYCSFGGDRNSPVRLCSALGSRAMTFSNMVWDGGGGGLCAAVGNAVAAITAGYSEFVVVYRGLSQGQFGRFGKGRESKVVRGRAAYSVPYGAISPVHFIAMRTNAFLYKYGLSTEVLFPIAMASYTHAQSNPKALMFGKPLTREKYLASRWISEPFRLYDCCQENDGAAAIVLTSAERARHLVEHPAYVTGVVQGGDPGYDLISAGDFDYASANFKAVAKRLYEQTGVSPADIDVLQAYENFTGGVLMSIVEHGFCAPEQAAEFLELENLLVGGALPLNTSGGNLAECYMHGLELIIEAVNQLNGRSCNQVENPTFCGVIGGPATSPVSSLVLGSGL